MYVNDSLFRSLVVAINLTVVAVQKSRTEIQNPINFSNASQTCPQVRIAQCAHRLRKYQLREATSPVTGRTSQVLAGFGFYQKR